VLGHHRRAHRLVDGHRNRNARLHAAQRQQHRSKQQRRAERIPDGQQPCDVYAVPTPSLPSSFNGDFFTPPFERDSLPLIITGPRVIKSQLSGPLPGRSDAGQSDGPPAGRCGTAMSQGCDALEDHHQSAGGGRISDLNVTLTSSTRITLEFRRSGSCSGWHADSAALNELGAFPKSELSGCWMLRVTLRSPDRHPG